MDEVISQETLRLAKWSAVLDVVCLGVTWILGYSPKQMALGLLFGTLFLLLNFQLIGISVKRSLGSSSPEKAKRKMTLGALGRYALSGVVIWVGIRSPMLHVFGVVFPLLYPKLIYYFGAVIDLFRKGKEEKR